MQSAGRIQAHLLLIAVVRHHRRQGIGRRLIEEAFVHCGGKLVDLLSESGEEVYPSPRSCWIKIKPAWVVRLIYMNGEYGIRTRDLRLARAAQMCSRVFIVHHFNTLASLLRLKYILNIPSFSFKTILRTIRMWEWR